MLSPEELSKHSVLSVLSDLASGAAALVRRELALLRKEMAAALEAVAAGTLWVAAAAVLGLLGAVSLIASLVLVIGDQWLPNDRYWVGGLLMTALSGVAAFLLMTRAKAYLRPRSLMPHETADTLRDDRDWARSELGIRQPRATAPLSLHEGQSR